MFLLREEHKMARLLQAEDGMIVSRTWRRGIWVFLSSCYYSTPFVLHKDINALFILLLKSHEW
jgi:hypothetical protein